MRTLDIEEMKSVSGGICYRDPNNISGCLPPKPSDCNDLYCLESLPFDNAFPNVQQ